MAVSLEKIVDELSGLTILEVSELVKALEEKWGVSAAAPVAAVAAVAGGADAGQAQAEQTQFDVILSGAEDGKTLTVVKQLRTVMKELSIMDAKKMVDSASSAPVAVLEGASKEDAQAAAKLLAEAGAKVEVK